MKQVKACNPNIPTIEDISEVIRAMNHLVYIFDSVYKVKQAMDYFNSSFSGAIDLYTKAMEDFKKKYPIPEIEEVIKQSDKK